MTGKNSTFRTRQETWEDILCCLCADNVFEFVLSAGEIGQVGDIKLLIGQCAAFRYARSRWPNGRVYSLW